MKKLTKRVLFSMTCAVLILMSFCTFYIPLYAAGVSLSLSGNGLSVKKLDESEYENASYDAENVNIEYIVEVTFEDEEPHETVVETTLRYQDITDYTVMILGDDLMFETAEDAVYDKEAGTITFSAESGDIIAVAADNAVTFDLEDLKTGKEYDGSEEETEIRLVLSYLRIFGIVLIGLSVCFALLAFHFENDDMIIISSFPFCIGIILFVVSNILLE